MGKIKIYVFGVMVIALFISGILIKSLWGENAILSDNQNAFIKNEVAANNEKAELQLNVSDLKKVISQDSTLKSVMRDSLDLQANKINTLTKLGSETKLHIVTQLKDTTIYETDTVYISKKFNWQNPWYKAEGVISLLPEKETIDMMIIGNDTIYYFSADEKYRKFFLRRWFEKPTRVTKIWNANPHQNIVVRQSITKIK